MATGKFDQYVVKSGDTLSDIALDCGLSVEELRLLNPDIVDVGRIYVDQVLNVPPVERPAGEYIVKKGDTFSEIAESLGFSQQVLAQANPQIKELGVIGIGDAIYLPDEGVVSSSVEADSVETVFYSEVEGFDPDLSPGGEKFILQPEVERSVPVIGGDAGEFGVAARAAAPDFVFFPDVVEFVESFDLSGVLGVGEVPEVVDVPEVSDAPDDIEVAEEAAEGGGNIEFPEDAIVQDVPSASSIPQAAIDNAWRRVEGQSVQPHFQDVAYDQRPLVVIDLGHKAYTRYYENDKGKMVRNLDPGAVGQSGLTEVAVVDPVGLAFADALVERGHRVAFSRGPGEIYRYSSGDGVGRLASRARYSHALEDELNAPFTVFVSLHANACEYKSAHGMEVLIAGRANGKSGVSPLNVESQSLAESVLKSVDGYGGLRNRGVKPRTNVAVLNVMEKGDPGVRQQPDAAILLELAFLSNEKDEAVLAGMSENPQDVADRLADGVHSYIDTRLNTVPTLIADHEKGYDPKV